MIIIENIIDFALLRSDMIVCQIVPAHLGDTKRLERLLLLDLLRDRVESLWLALAEAKHVFETLPVTLAAIAWDWVVFSVNHRVVNVESGILKRNRVTITRQCLVTVQSPVADHPNNDAAWGGLLIERRGYLLNRKMISVIVAQVIIRRTRYRHIDTIVGHPIQCI